MFGLGLVVLLLAGGGITYCSVYRDGERAGVEKTYKEIKNFTIADDKARARQYKKDVKKGEKEIKKIKKKDHGQPPERGDIVDGVKNIFKGGK